MIHITYKYIYSKLYGCSCALADRDIVEADIIKQQKFLASGRDGNSNLSHVNFGGCVGVLMVIVNTDCNLDIIEILNLCGG